MARNIRKGQSGEFANHVIDMVAKQPPGIAIGNHCDAGFGTVLQSCCSLLFYIHLSF